MVTCWLFPDNFAVNILCDLLCLRFPLLSIDASDSLSKLETFRIFQHLSYIELEQLETQSQTPDEY